MVKVRRSKAGWYGIVIYSGLIFILHILLKFFINMSLNILSFFHLIYHCIICKLWFRWHV
jgi:hypothetical protein